MMKFFVMFASCKRLLLFFALCSCFGMLRAQVGEARNTIAVGANGGVVMNTVMFDPTIKQKMHPGTTFGLAFRLTCEKYFKTLCALQVEINHTRLGWKENIIDRTTNEPLPDRYQRDLDYIQIPFLARLGWGHEQRGLMGYFLAGPQIGFCYKETSRRSLAWTLDEEGYPNRPNGMYMQYDMPVENKFDYGITGGFGVELSTRVGHFMLDGRYYYGLSDLYGNSKKDVFAKSNNGTFMVKFSYMIDL